ncbi:MAG: hypothetical protein H6818_10620 [Phycisphaerales bacterium]|nr:hypothetical protein [Phycisphaerales bacterium]
MGAAKTAKRSERNPWKSVFSFRFRPEGAEELLDSLTPRARQIAATRTNETTQRNIALNPIHTQQQWRTCLIAAAMAMAFTPTAYAHPVSLSRATAVVHPDHVSVSIEAPGEDLLHYSLIEPSDDDAYLRADIRRAGRHYGDMLRDGFILRDAAGKRLKATTTAFDITPAAADDARELLFNVWVNVTIRYDANDKSPLQFITFQHRPPVTTQILLTRTGTTVRQASSQQTRELILTSGGNAETLEFNWDDKMTAANPSPSPQQKNARTWLGDERFKQVHAILEFDQQGPMLRIAVPLAITETWRPILRKNDETVSAEEQAGVVEDWRQRFAKAVAVRINGHESIPSVDDVIVIGPAAPERVIKDKTAPVGFHSGRLVGVLRLSTDRKVDAIDLTWKLFNEAVPVARVLVIEGKDAVEYPVSKYAPTFRWHNDD